MTGACPSCGAVAPVAGRFCEVCGSDLRPEQPLTSLHEPTTSSPEPTGPGPPAPGTPAAWEVRAEADRSYFAKVEADGVDFPAEPPDRSFQLEKDRATIGRSSASRGIYPDIDLAGPPTDTGVSHWHAVLLRQAGGSWAILDPGSTNGTYLNDNSEAIPRNQPVPIVAGDRIHIGAWTTLTLRPAAE